MKINYGGNSPTNLTCTLTNLINSTALAFIGRQSANYDNSALGYLDMLIRLKTKGASASCTGLVYIWAASAVEITTPVYVDGCTGADGSFTAPSGGTNMKLIGVCQMSGTTSVVSSSFSIGAAFGGSLPPKAAIVVQNASGASLDSTGANHSLDFVGLNTS